MIEVNKFLSGIPILVGSDRSPVDINMPGVDDIDVEVRREIITIHLGCGTLHQVMGEEAAELWLETNRKNQQLQYLIALEQYN